MGKFLIKEQLRLKVLSGMLTENNYQRLIDQIAQEKNNLGEGIFSETDFLEQEEGAGFAEFLKKEYGDTPTPDEAGLAITNWAEGYMIGDNDADFKGVSEYLNKEIYDKIKTGISTNYIEDFKDYMEQKGQGSFLAEQDQGEDVIGNKIEDVLDNIMRNLSASLINVSKKIGDKDGEFDIPPQQQREIHLNEEKINEIIGLFVANVVASAPAIITLAGKLIKKLGGSSKVNSGVLKKVGESMEGFGTKWQSKYNNLIKKALMKVMPKASEKQLDVATKVVFMTILSTIGISSALTTPIAGIEAVATGLGGAKTAVAADKAKDFVKQIASKLDRKAIAEKASKLIPAALAEFFA